jgi:hypothetical protein
MGDHATAIDLVRARRETPGCAQVLHFNNAGAALMPASVLAATIGHLELEGRIGGYEAEELAHGAVECVYDAAARLINCARDEIAVVENATRAWDMAFYAIPFRPGDRILTATAEYASRCIAYPMASSRGTSYLEADFMGTALCVSVRKSPCMSAGDGVKIGVKVDSYRCSPRYLIGSSAMTICWRWCFQLRLLPTVW